MESIIDSYVGEYLWTESREKQVIDILEGKTCIKDRNYYHMKKLFTLIECDGVKKVAKLKNPKIMANRKEVLTIIRNAHMACGHMGEKKTYDKICENYENIPLILVRKFIQQCETCAKKTEKSSQAKTVVDSLTSDFSLCGQVDIIDFQSSPDGEYKFILHYQEKLTKFCFLRPLKTKTIAEIARKLLNMFIDLRPPDVLYSNSGVEFTAKLIKEMRSLFSYIVLVNGRLRYPESPDSVERRNQTIKDCLITWTRDNNESWSSGLGPLTWKLNSSYNEAIKMEPYRAVFGRPPTMGLASVLPAKLLEKITNGMTEEEFEELINSENIEAKTRLKM